MKKLGIFGKIIAAITVICLSLSFVACGTPVNGQQDETTVSESSPVLEFFEYDAVVNNFFVSYNAIATNVIKAEKIEKGYIKTKALVYADSFSLEVTNTNSGTLAISIETKPENEDTAMFAVFSDCIKAMTTLSNDEITNAWNAIHETGYMVENYEANGVLITYIPAKELSWGINNPSVDLTITIG